MKAGEASVKISGRKGKEPGNGSSRRTRGVQGKGPAGSAGPEANRTLDAFPKARVEKVERIQSEMNDGTYKVEGRRVAEKMVTDAVRELRKRNC
ncbi:MAG: hypothetical protein B7Z62_02175 [Deltaproteobacteria bacterium 37-65-8]|nr:MAG: hypothetical protein B7Z62_02175 [Deltaproteobacteria bacterium 37-65-8]